MELKITQSIYFDLDNIISDCGEEVKNDWLEAKSVNKGRYYLLILTDKNADQFHTCFQSLQNVNENSDHYSYKYCEALKKYAAAIRQEFSVRKI